MRRPAHAATGAVQGRVTSIRRTGAPFVGTRRGGRHRPAYTAAMKLDRALVHASWQSWVGGRLTRVGPYWLQWVWTLLFCLAMAVVFTVLGFFAFARDADGA